MNETFGQRLKRIRKEKGFKQYQLAEKAGITPQALCDYEKEEYCPSLASLEWLCKALGVSASELLGF